MPKYAGKKTKEISFPIGGLGSGCIGLGGNGRFRDWEIFNRPSKNSANAFTHILVRAEKGEQVLDARVLQGDWPGAAVGGETSNIYRGNGGYGYGVGPFRGTMAGLPHFGRHDFLGEFPYATLEFSDPKFPGLVTLRAFNPFIPMNDKDSSLPVAFLQVCFQNNNSDAAIDYTAFFTLNNPLPHGTTVNRIKQKDCITAITMSSAAVDKEDPLFGELCIATDADDTSWQEYWVRALWFDSLTKFWADVQKGGKLQNRRYEAITDGNPPYKLDGEEPGTLAVHVHLAPGESRSLRFVLGWYFPNCVNFWNPETKSGRQEIWKHFYDSLFSSAFECCAYALKNWVRLDEDTQRFKDALFSSTLPDYALDAISANLSTLKSATCLRLTNGEFYGFEGCGTNTGCCEGNCSHVWNYAYALPFLFPKLERSMRDLDYRYNQRQDGGMSFRLMLPLGRERCEFRPCVDGQMGGVIQVWRDYLICGDLEWLRGKWPAVQRAIEFAWAQSNEDGWDADRDGVLEGRQHHTLDMELFGPSSWLNGFYLAALKAASKIACRVGDDEKEKQYSEIYEKGRAWCNENLYNGEYFRQRIDLTDLSLLKRYAAVKPLEGSSTLDAYWDDTEGEIRYQIAEGCAADQVIAQWHANLCGLGDVFDPVKVKQALKAIYKYNYMPAARDVFNPARLFCIDGESGVRICTWPQGVQRPASPITYASEVFCGIEYQVAAHMLQMGLRDEAFSIVRSVRARFDGENRNPWNEFECGSNYVRSMASYSLIPSVSGFSCDLGAGYIGFNPTIQAPGGAFSCFFSVDGAWGSYKQLGCSIEISIDYGGVDLLSIGLPAGLHPVSTQVDGSALDFSVNDTCLTFPRRLRMSRNQKLLITCNMAST